MPPVSRRFLLIGAGLSATSLLIPVTVARARAATRGDDYEITAQFESRVRQRVRLVVRDGTRVVVAHSTGSSSLDWAF